MSPTTGIEPPSRMKTGLVAKAGLDRADRRLDAGGIDIDQNGRRTVMGDDLVGHARRADPGDVLPELPLDRLGVLVGNQAEAELRARLARKHRLGAGPGSNRRRCR